MVYRENEAPRPRVGSIVLVRVKERLGAEPSDRAAIVTRVLNTGNVDLSSFGPGEIEVTPMGNRTFDPTGNELGTWRWPEE